jgi:hypothetical protein
VSDKTPEKTEEKTEKTEPKPAQPREIGGPKGPEPTRYNDWEKNGRCVDF